MAQGTPSSTPLYSSTFLNLCLFSKSKVANTNIQEQLSVRSHEKYFAGDGTYSANREELEIIPYQEGLYQFWGWEVVWVIHLEKEVVQRAS